MASVALPMTLSKLTSAAQDAFIQDELSAALSDLMNNLTNFSDQQVAVVVSLTNKSRSFWYNSSASCWAALPSQRT
jgi:hypothetical protein